MPETVAIASAERARSFENDGYLVVQDVFDPATVFGPVFDTYQRVLDGITDSLCVRGLLSSPYRGLGFLERLIAVTRETGLKLHQHFELSLPFRDEIETETSMCWDPAIFDALTNSSVLDLVESIIGPEIELSPIAHVRIKLPQSAMKAEWQNDATIARAAWHQDNSAMDEVADETQVITVWMPLNVASLENGCLETVLESHHRGLLPHCPQEHGATVPESLFADMQVVAHPMSPGSILMMNKRMLHRSGDNLTDGARISFDLRYQVAGQHSGRAAYPSFLVRSRSRPDRVVDAATWSREWQAARDAAVGLSHLSTSIAGRWRGGGPVCA